MTDPAQRDDLEAILALHAERGGTVDPALVDSLAAKVQASVAAQVNKELELVRAPRQPKPGQLALAITSMGIASPLLAIAGDTSGLLGILLTLAAIVVINAVYGWDGRFGR